MKAIIKDIDNYWTKNKKKIYPYWKDRYIAIPYNRNYENHLIAVHFFNELMDIKIITLDKVEQLRINICESFPEVTEQDFWNIINESNTDTMKSVACNLDPHKNNRNNESLKNLNAKLDFVNNILLREKHEEMFATETTKLIN